MKTEIIIMVLIYEIVVVFGVGLYLSYKQKKKKVTGDFALAGRNMGVAMLAPTMALTALGSAHITGIYEMSFGMGAIAIWFSLAHVAFFVILCLFTGPWVRRLNITTISGCIRDMYGEKVSLSITCVMAGVTFGILTLETQGIGIVVNALTGWPIVTAIFIGGIFGIFYVFLAGMKQVSVVNFINIFVLYIGVIATVIYIVSDLPGGTFNIVRDTLNADPSTEFMTSMMGTPELWFTFALSNIITVAFYGPVSQQNTQAVMAAKNTKVIRQSLWIVAPLNALFGVFTVIIGLTARSIPEYAALGPKSAAMGMLVDKLPPFVTAILLAALLAAILSTFAMTALCCATIFGYDIYKGLFNKEASDKSLTRIIRTVIVIVCVVALFVSTTLPTIIAAINWAFAWVIPVFWLFTFGLFWKRSAKVAGITLVITWIINCLWSLTSLPALFGTTANAVPNGYVTLVVGFIIVLIGNLTVKNSKPGLWVEIRQQKAVLSSVGK